ncbi:MAG: ASCH domain-containing protein [Nitriliruptorales bacterium]|nr:ASCH domain-containing protein [Nitriliruptorales bacterium]
MTTIEPDADALAAFTHEFREATGYDGPIGHFAFGDTPEMADELGQLVREGPKRATAGWVADEEADPPAEGQHDVVLGGDGSPICLIRTDEAETRPFKTADPAFAWDEGEGDRTLAWWRDAHVSFFTRRSEVVGEPFTDDSLVTFERFSVVWPELDPPGPHFEDGELLVRPVRADDRGWVAEVLGETASRDGWAVDRCPGLLARHQGQTAGVLVFVPWTGRTEIVGTAVLEEVGGVEDGLRDGLARLRDTYDWGPIDD